MRRRHLKGLLDALVFSVTVSTAGCGNDGDPPPAAPIAAEEEPGAVLSPEPKAVSGSFFLGDLLQPAEDYEIWIVDHSSEAFERLTLSAAGAFTVPIEQFVEDSTYSLHLVRDFRLALDVDLSTSLAGVQSGFIYRGGYGFELGQVVLPLTPQGTLDVEAAPAGRVGGGFSLGRDTSVSLRTIADPAHVESFGIGSQLVVLDPTLLLYGHYLASSNPRIRAQLLSESSRLLVKATVDPKRITRVFGIDGGPWLGAARLTPEDGTDPSSAPRWSDFGMDVPGVGDELRASLGIGGLPVAESIVILRTQPDQGAQTIVPKVLPRVLTTLPSLIGLASPAGQSVVIDYSSTTKANGLTRPFCQFGEVVLRLTPPLPGGIFDVIAVSFDYFGLAGGRSVPLQSTSKSFPEAYQKISSVWNPVTRTYTFPFDAAGAAATEQSVTIPGAVLLEAIGPAGVIKTRLRVHYRSSTEATEATIAVWLTRDC